MNRWGKDWAPYKTVKTVPILYKSALLHFKEPGWGGYIKETLPDKATLLRNLSKVRASNVDDEGDELDQISDMVAERKAYAAHLEASAEEKTSFGRRQRLMAAGETTGGAEGKAAAAEAHAATHKDTTDKADAAHKAHLKALEKATKRGAPKLSEDLLIELATIEENAKKAGKSKLYIRTLQREHKKLYKENARKEAIAEARAKKGGGAAPPAASVGGGGSAAAAAAASRGGGGGGEGDSDAEEAEGKRTLSKEELKSEFAVIGVKSIDEFNEAVVTLSDEEVADFAKALGCKVEDESGKPLERKELLKVLDVLVRKAFSIFSD